MIMTCRSSIVLAPGDIHLWLADYSEIQDPLLHERYRALLPEEERAREPRFYFQKDRDRYLVTRTLVRTVLSRYAPLQPQDWTFSANAFGRPEIANPEVRSLDLTFNISHTHSLIVLGVTSARALGVDVENVLSRKVSLGIADHYFAPEEVAELARHPEHRQHDLFFEYWTFKESYIKARGMGLSLPLEKFSFRFAAEDRVDISISEDLADDARRWQFWSLRAFENYLIAVCAERVRSEASQLVIRKTVPMLSETTIGPTYARTSD